MAGSRAGGVPCPGSRESRERSSGKCSLGPGPADRPMLSAVSQRARSLVDSIEVYSSGFGRCSFGRRTFAFDKDRLVANRHHEHSDFLQDALELTRELRGASEIPNSILTKRNDLSGQKPTSLPWRTYERARPRPELLPNRRAPPSQLVPSQSTLR